MYSPNKGRIKYEGLGVFLDPPTYPTHTMSVETDLRRRKWNRGGMSLEYAATCEYLDAGTRERAARILRDWERPAIDSPAIQDWIRNVLGYFRDCYRGEGPEPDCWHAGKLHIAKGSNGVLNADIHAGVHLIRKFYPEFKPTAEHFERAYWEQKAS